MPKKKFCPECFNLIGERTRMRIIRYLRKKPNKAGKIGANFLLTQPTISHHLRVLEKVGMLVSKQKGREVYYFLNKKYPCKKCFIFNIPLKI